MPRYVVQRDGLRMIPLAEKPSFPEHPDPLPPPAAPEDPHELLKVRVAACVAVSVRARVIDTMSSPGATTGAFRSRHVPAVMRPPAPECSRSAPTAAGLVAQAAARWVGLHHPDGTPTPMHLFLACALP
jgi:hypothetical protein